MTGERRREGRPGRPGGFDWKHALEELVLIVVGVLLALALNDWSQARHDRRSEVEALEEIRAALRQDLADVRSDLDRHRRAATAAEAMLARSGSDVACSDSVGPEVAALLSEPWHVSNTAAYESLKARGIALIGDDSLRLAVIHLYAYRNTVIAIANEQGNRFVEEVLRPYVRARFRPDPAGEAVPVDCAAVARDPTFRGLLVEALARRRFAISRYEPAQAEIQSLLEAIGQAATGPPEVAGADRQGPRSPAPKPAVP